MYSRKLLPGLAFFLAITSGQASANANIDKMTTYAVLLGRAMGCGVEVKKPMERVGAWMDKVFPPGSEDQRVILPIFVQGLVDHSKAQSEGRSPDSCSQVRTAINKTKWP
ncbi:hypothetical protein [Comamonas testosteroni]|uniref:hypothetical protein n=1 Tax=Comamonas testosteroni TaxID=285 RepID=UPI0011466940|nr:hypothetical protein [Comamonas testosteroni]